VKPPVLWIRGSDDQIVSDNSLFCFGTLGKLGFIPNYPGEDVYPPQPMVSQTRHVLDRYTQAGGQYREVVMADTGHSPFIEKPGEFMEHFSAHLSA
jgi:pimeloyl-ACP methyl ester carboxylesterase